MGVNSFDDLNRQFSSKVISDHTARSCQTGDDLGIGLDISGFFRIIRQQWFSIALTTLLALLMATAYTLTATTKFTASSKILINPQPKRVLGSDYIPQDGGTNEILIESQTRVIASNAVLARVVESQNLMSDPEFSGAADPGFVGWVKQLVGLPVDEGDVLMSQARAQEALRRLHEKLAVKRPSKTYVLEVAVSSRDAEKAAMLSRAVSDAYIMDQAETQANSTQKMSELLQDRLASLRGKVLEAETKVQQFRQRHNIVATEGALVNERHLGRLNDELLAAKNRLTAAEAKALKVRSLIQSGSIPEDFDEAIKSRVIAALREQYAATARREAQLSSVLGARHPQLIAARARVSSSKRLINAELRRIAGSLQGDMEIEKRRVEALEKRLDKSRGVTDLTNTARVELAAYEREANASRAVYERMLTKARESSAQEKINLIDARVISYASAPLWASWPKKKIIFPVALLLGLGLGLAGALVNDYRRDRFTSNEDVEQTIGLRVLGTIPSFTQGAFSSLRALFARHKAGSAGQSPYYRLYVELSKVGSPYATAIMGLVRNLTKLKASKASGPAAQSIMMVSSRDHEGSSSVAWSTAISAAMQNRKVLLIDGDGGNGELAETLAPDNQQALADVLSGDGKLGDLIVEDKELGLSFLPIVKAGKKHQTIHWGDYQSLLAQLPQVSKDFDLVIVDGGAILNSGLAHILVDHVDSVTLVVRMDETSRKTVHEALRAIDVPAAKMRGVIVSTVDPDTV